MLVFVDLTIAQDVLFLYTQFKHPAGAESGHVQTV